MATHLARLVEISGLRRSRALQYTGAPVCGSEGGLERCASKGKSK